MNPITETKLLLVVVIAATTGSAYAPYCPKLLLAAVAGMAAGRIVRRLTREYENRMKGS
jgi:hypothetical protein